VVRQLVPSTETPTTLAATSSVAEASGGYAIVCVGERKRATQQQGNRNPRPRNPGDRES